MRDGSAWRTAEHSRHVDVEVQQSDESGNVPRTMSLIPPHSKFSCVALRSASVGDLGGVPVSLGNGLWSVSRIPFELQDLWKEWIGTLQSKELLGANLCLFAIAPSANPGVLDSENEALRSTAERVFFGLVLHGLRYERGYILSGAHHEGAIDVRQFTVLRDFHPNPEREPTLITVDLLRRGIVVAKAIEEIFSPVAHPGGSNPEPKRFRRLRRGFLALLRGYEEGWWDTRLHQFVRAIEALLSLPVGESTKKFAHRSQAFIGASDESRQLLTEIYQLRSCAEHMNPMETVLPGPEPHRTAWKRCLQSELMASEIYLRLFSTPDLLQHFTDDDAILALWKEKDHVVHAVWGKPLELSAIVDAVYRPIHGLES